ncbi:MAG: HEPN domain-containing protein [Spirochaetota bacterium]
MNEKTIQNWIQLAVYDFDTAKAMLKSKRYLYLAFACHQTVEKILKAIYVKEIGKTPPYTHNLIKLSESISISGSMNEEFKKFIEDLNSYYIQSRYNEDIARMTAILTKKKSRLIFKGTEALYLWLKKQI